MPLWGKRDSFAITGTISVNDESTTVTGSGTAFTTELDIGDMVTIVGVKYKVVDIIDNEELKISPAYDGTNVSGGTITGQDTPKYLLPADGRNTFGVDVTEAQVNTRDAGWVNRNTYVDIHGVTRDKREVLVALSSISADAADDAVYPDAIITILTQPEDSSEDSGNTVTFTVVTSVDPAGTTINHRWQESDGTSAFVNLTDTGVYSNTDTSTLTISDNTGLDGYVYRVQLSAAGVSANTVSANATLTELP
jgi:hypothetical protein